jgi:hypothetical protein
VHRFHPLELVSGSSDDFFGTTAHCEISSVLPSETHRVFLHPIGHLIKIMWLFIFYRNFQLCFFINWVNDDLWLLVLLLFSLWMILNGDFALWARRRNNEETICVIFIKF